ncbi:MAG TPA: ATP-binding protein [Myxococcota bacterium]|nr:ATP-binding protein [Myxococcota bacterium]
MARKTRGIRFQISLLLLLSALNGIVLLGLVLILATGELEAGSKTLLLAGLVSWVIASTVVTVASAFRLQKALSAPLEEVGNAARRVAAGELDRPIPIPDAAAEFVDLGKSLETMRWSLVDLIGELDTHNETVTAMLDALSDGVLMADGERQVDSWNPAAEHLLGVAGLGQLRKGALLDQVLGVDSALFAGESKRANLDFDLDGEPLHLVLRTQPLARGWVVVIRDVTEAVEINNIKQEFLSVVTHELKTPLTVIQGYIRLLMMGKGGDLTPKQADLLQRSRDQSDVLYRMVQDLLDATRLEGGNLALDVVPTDLPGQLEDAHSAFSGEALRRRVKLELDCTLRSGSQLQADPMRLQQILGNLVRNALKFTEPGGTVTIRASEKDGHALVAIEDTGRGIPEDSVDRLFQKFYQVERGDTRRSGGAGLGLYIVDQLTTAMNGTIEVRSEVGTGSTFTLRFPLGVTASA